MVGAEKTFGVMRIRDRLLAIVPNTAGAGLTIMMWVSTIVFHSGPPKRRPPARQGRTGECSPA
jgi:hypothetical protein